MREIGEYIPADDPGWDDWDALGPPTRADKLLAEYMDTLNSEWPATAKSDAMVADVKLFLELAGDALALKRRLNP